ncbi:hypothetical protein BPOR_0283g00060 [Botrytis porri]|uniref:BTB domain-containing protein n=1 Tax=Botrytis porri TaxID=87229 RepID=A0A4Z1KKV2_9HELO|nr:hypothetical protein BPOR_0283g00060 [Botrytis porri]
MFQQIVLRTNKKPGSQHGNLEKPSLSDQPPCNTDLGDDMISIQVGEGSRATEFMVPKGPSCRRVPFFNAMFNQGWLESATQSCTLPDDDPEAFSILMHWVFDVPHEAPVTFTLSGFQKHPETYINLAILAGKYLIDDLPDLIEARLIQKDLTRLNDPCYELPKSSWYRLAWELLPIVPILRKYYSTQKASHQFVYINENGRRCLRAGETPVKHSESSESSDTWKTGTRLAMKFRTSLGDIRTCVTIWTIFPVQQPCQMKDSYDFFGAP